MDKNYSFTLAEVLERIVEDDTFRNDLLNNMKEVAKMLLERIDEHKKKEGC